MTQLEKAREEIRSNTPPDIVEQDNLSFLNTKTCNSCDSLLDSLNLCPICDYSYPYEF